MFFQTSASQLSNDEWRRDQLHARKLLWGIESVGDASLIYSDLTTTWNERYVIAFKALYENLFCTPESWPERWTVVTNTTGSHCIISLL